MPPPKRAERIRPAIVAFEGLVKARLEDSDDWLSIEDLCLDERDTLLTPPGGHLDLQFGDSGPVVRFTENTECALTELGYEEKDGQILLHIVIDLTEGSLASDLTELPPGATFLIRTLSWVLWAHGGALEAKSDGTILVQTGQVRVDNPDTGRHTVTAGEHYNP
jgi:hypothetical protein